MTAVLTAIRGYSDNLTMTAAPIRATGHSTVVYSNSFLELEETPVSFPDGSQGIYARLNRGTHGGVAIPRSVTRGVARYGLVRQYRHAVEQTTLEFPRGGTDDSSEAETVRELVEETGLAVDPGSSIYLGKIHADTGILATEVSVWLVPIRDIGDSAFVEAETGASHFWVTEGELLGLIAQGKIVCGMTLAAFIKLLASPYAVAPH